MILQEGEDKGELHNHSQIGQSDLTVKLSDKQCFICQATGHLNRKCPYKDAGLEGHTN